MLFGTSKDVTLGPTAIVSLLTESSTRGCGDTQARIVCATALTFLSGAIQFAVGILNLGESPPIDLLRLGELDSLFLITTRLL